MRLKQLRVCDFRNIEEAQIELSPQFNAITGANGAGKTSLLEAIFTLGHGRSFRSRLTQPLIRQGSKEYLVFARCVTQQQIEFKLGLTKGSDVPRIHINDESLTSMSELARLFPVVEIDAASLSLIDEGPALRRSFLDWGVFHVEQIPGSLWVRFRRVLQQRNSLLKKQGHEDHEFWDREFVDLCQQIDLARRKYLDRLNALFGSLAESLLGDMSEQVALEYFPGWSEDAESLSESLVRVRPRELALGRTIKGAHCADLRLLVGGEPAKDRLSRGQKKLFVAALKFAQVRLYNEQHSEHAILLLDDFAAELDATSMNRVRGALGELQCQIVAAAVNPDELAKLNPFRGVEVFHVEHGKINRRKESKQSG
jgi:DNA replication and repair protein RecF